VEGVGIVLDGMMLLEDSEVVVVEGSMVLENLEVLGEVDLKRFRR
jgi:uridine kinase